jgi:hypothetical protein
MRGLMGSFAVLPLAEIVDLLSRRRMTGALSCERGAVRKTIHVREGTAVAAASNDPREYLGQLLVNFGHLDEEQLARAFRRQQETRVRLGKVLTESGVVPAERVQEALAIKIRETLLDVFLWESGIFSFEDEAPPALDELDVSVPLADIAREAEFRATAWSAMRGEFPTGAAALEVSRAELPPELGPDTIDGKVIALARDGKTIDEIGLALHAPDFHLYQRLYALARRGILSAATTAPGVAPGEVIATTDLIDRSRSLLAEGRPADAERVAARAVELDPSSDAARSLLAAAERLLLARLRAELLDPSRAPTPRVRPEEIPRLPLSAADRYLLSRCDGRRAVHDLAELAPFAELELLKGIRRLVEAELVELRAR